MKFLADMGISPRVVDWLQSAGHDAIHVLDCGLDRAPDSAILEQARAEQRVLLTHDLDFGELLAFSQNDQPGVIIFRLRDMRPITVQKYLGEILENHADILEAGSLASVTERRIRIRRLPI